MNFKHLIILFCFLSIGTSAQKKVWTLEDCIRYALDNNITVKQSELDISEAQLQKKQAFGNFLPTVNAGMSYNWNQGTNINPVTNQFENHFFESASGGISAGVDLFNGLRKWKQYQQAKLGILASTYQLEKIKDDITLNVANAYLEILSAKEKKKVIEAQSQLTEQNIQRTKELIEAGSLPKGNLYELEAQQASQEQQKASIETQLFIAKMALAQLLLIEDYANFDISEEEAEVPLTDILSYSAQEIIQRAKENRSELKIAQTNVALSELGLQLSKSSLLPKLSASLGYNSRWSKTIQQYNFWEQVNNNKGLSAGLSLSIPILNGFSAQNSIQQKKIAVEKSKINLQQTALNMDRSIYQAYNDAVNAEKLYNATQKMAQSKKLSYEYAKERYDVGLLDIFGFHQVKLQYENAETEAIQAKYNYIFKIKVLEYYFGIPLIDITSHQK